MTEEVRLNRFLARAGVASRRGADDIIAERRVRVNGEIVTEMGSKVSPTDRVEVDGRPITPAGLVYILLNKPTDTITTADDEKGRKTVLDLVDLEGGEGDALFPVGRLDRNTTGALLLTTDGDLAHRLMHPRYGANKLYLATTERPVTAPEIEALRAGVELEDGLAKADQVGYVDEDKRKVALALHEGRNRQVRRMLEHLGHEVNALERVGYAGLDLSGLRRGRWRRLQAHEVNMLRRSVKLKAIVF
ncbi:hypothetical protein BSZ36_07265 [Rubricoccus marinus]|uniref:Pseudouridine synthase n=1 Tax=Rubricoccus marinus TaxID=716817 RepID=A0A259U461_9BACT|nr:hypothetical protein BSZ36_07265 [Rubricoccus marinus]